MEIEHPERKYIVLAMIIVVLYSQVVNIFLVTSMVIKFDIFSIFDFVDFLLIIFFAGPGSIFSIENFPFYSALAIAGCALLAYAAAKLCSIIFLMLFIIAWFAGGILGIASF